MQKKYRTCRTCKRTLDLRCFEPYIAPSGRSKGRKYSCPSCVSRYHDRSFPRQVHIDRFWSKFNIEAEGCWEWPGATTHNGYGVVQWKKEGGERTAARAHRVAYALAKGPIPEGMMVLHSCDNRLCCNPKHLRVGTASDNTKDMMLRGRHRGPKRGSERLHRGL